MFAILTTRPDEMMYRSNFNKHEKAVRYGEDLLRTKSIIDYEVMPQEYFNMVYRVCSIDLTNGEINVVDKSRASLKAARLDVQKSNENAVRLFFWLQPVGVHFPLWAQQLRAYIRGCMDNQRELLAIEDEAWATTKRMVVLVTHCVEQKVVTQKLYASTTPYLQRTLTQIMDGMVDYDHIDINERDNVDYTMCDGSHTYITFISVKRLIEEFAK